ncbi:hypothetical protein DD594_26365 [Enterobacter cloacae complex sp. 4DZ1-17B1]|nr:hypothetical protein DD594_26365 [Enterobacter cloacae complex sp. 4DZ1-17B1]
MMFTLMNPNIILNQRGLRRLEELSSKKMDLHVQDKMSGLKRSKDRIEWNHRLWLSLSHLLCVDLDMSRDLLIGLFHL